MTSGRDLQCRFCERLVGRKGNQTERLCSPHYQRLMRHGHPLGGGPERMTGTSKEEQFWAKVDKDGPIPAHEPSLGRCWVWTAGTSHGYGRFRSHDETVGAHRWSLERSSGPIPAGREVCHRCDNPPCVRPSHLYAGTSSDNTRDMLARGRHVARSKLSEWDVRDIREIYGNGVCTQQVLADYYGVSAGYVSTIVNRIERGDVLDIDGRRSA